jgi:integrase
LYLLANDTGLRASEVGRLRPRDFLLRRRSPCVMFPSVKGTRPVQRPLSKEVATMLEALLVTVPARQPIWPLTAIAVEYMLAAELEAAGIASAGGSGP